MNKRAASPLILIAAILVIAGSLFVISNIGSSSKTGFGFRTITGLDIATSTSCGEVNDSLTLTADISGDQCFNVTAPNVVIDCQGHTLTGIGVKNSPPLPLAPASWAIRTNVTINNVTVQNCNINNFDVGVFFEASNDSTMLNSTFTNNSRGVYVGCVNDLLFGASCSHRTNIFNNSFTNNSISVDVNINDFGTSTGNVITNNTFVAAPTSSSYNIGLFSCTNCSFTNNYVEINSGFFTQEYPRLNSVYFAGNYFLLKGATSLFAGGDDTHGNQFINNFVNYTTGTTTLFNCVGAGLGAGNWQIINNTFLGSGNFPAFFFGRGCYNVNIVNNTIHNFTYGAYVASSGPNMVFSGNNVSDIRNAGIELHVTSNTTIMSNIFSNMDVGVNWFLADTELPLYSSLGGGLVQDNLFNNINTTLFSNFITAVPAINNSLKITKRLDGIPYIIEDFGTVSFNLSRNLSMNYGGFRMTERLVALDTDEFPTLNTTANVSIRVLSCSPVPDIRVKSTFQKEVTGFTGADQVCNATSTPSCDNIVCGDNYLNFTVNEFSTYSVDPIDSCVVPRGGKEIFDIMGTAFLCNGTFNMTADGIKVPLVRDAVVECNSTALNGSSQGAGFEIVESSNATIHNCNVNNFANGVEFLIASGNDVLNNTISGSTTRSLWLLNSTSNLIQNNNLTTGFSAYCIKPEQLSVDNQFVNNSFMTCGTVMSSSVGSRNNSFINNSFTSIPGSIAVTDDPTTLLALGGDYWYGNYIFNSGSFSEQYPRAVIDSNVFNQSPSTFGVQTSIGEVVKNNLFLQSALLIYHLNSTVINNTINNGIMFGNTAIWINSFYGDVSNSIIANNTISNTPIGIRFDLGGVTVSGNSMVNDSLDFNSTTSSPTFFVNQDFKKNTSFGNVSFVAATFNFTNETYNSILLAQNIVSLNTSALPDLNRSANVSLILGNACSVKIYSKEGFPQTVSEILTAGQPCNSTTTPACTNLLCNSSDGVEHFDVSSFSGFSTGVSIISFSPNASGQMQSRDNQTNVTIIAPAGGSTTTFNVTASASNTTSVTFNWFVNGVLTFVDNVVNLVTGFFTSVFNYMFPDLTQTNITVVVNDSFTNDTFTFNRENCTDNDNDGFSTTPNCGAFDCNDNDPNVIPPQAGETITHSVIFCSGTYNLSSFINISAHNAVILCNDTNLVGSNIHDTIAMLYASTNSSSNITITKCNITNSSRAIVLDGSPNSSIIDNSFSNDDYAVVTQDNADNINVSNNTISGLQNEGIFILNPVNAQISNNYISNTVQSAIHMDDRGNRSKIFNNFITGIQNQAILMGFNSTSTVISNNTIINLTNAAGVFINDFSSNITISNNFIEVNNVSNFNAYGVFIGQNTLDVLLDSNILHNARTGIFINSNSVNLTISNNIINNTSDRGVFMSHPESGILFLNNTVTNLNSTGVWFDGCLNCNISDNIIRYARGDSIFLSSSVANVVLNNNNISDNLFNGIFAGEASNLTVTNNIISNTNQSGIFIFSNSNQAGFNIINNTVTNVSFGRADGSNFYHAIFLLAVSNLTVANNFISDTNNSGIFVFPNSGGTFNILNNVVNNTGQEEGYNAGQMQDAIEFLDFFSEPALVNISNNYVSNSNGSGIFMMQFTGADSAADIFNNTITNAGVFEDSSGNRVRPAMCIFGPGLGNVTISNNHITNSNGSGVHLEGSSGTDMKVINNTIDSVAQASDNSNGPTNAVDVINAFSVNFSNNHITNSNGSGLFLNNVQGKVIFDSNTVNNVGYQQRFGGNTQNAVSLISGAANTLAVSNNIITNSNGTGIFINSFFNGIQIDVINNTVANTGQTVDPGNSATQELLLSGNSVSLVNISNNKILESNSTGLQLDQNGGNYIIENNIINNTGYITDNYGARPAVRLNNLENVTFNHNTITNSNGSGILVDTGTPSIYVMSNNVINNTGFASDSFGPRQAVYLRNIQYISFSNNTITNTNGTGLQVEGNSGNNTFTNNLISDAGHALDLSYGPRQAVYLRNMQEVIFANNTISNSNGSGLQFEGGGGFGGNYTFANNTITSTGYVSDVSFGPRQAVYITNIGGAVFDSNIITNSNGSGLQFQGQNSNITNNIIINTGYANDTINGERPVVLIANGNINNKFSNNLLSVSNNTGLSIVFESNDVVFNNTFNNIKEDAISTQFTFNSTLKDNLFNNITGMHIRGDDASFRNTLILTRQQNQLEFSNEFINVTNINNLFVNNSIAAVNSSAEPQMNQSANISVIVPSCAVALYESPDFFIAKENAFSTAQNCTSCSDAICTGNELNFSTSHFSTIFASPIPIITRISPNATNRSQEILPEDANVTINIAGNSNITFNVTANLTGSNGTTVLTFQWFVDQVLQAVHNLVGVFTDVFGWLFNIGGEHNVTVVVNGSEPNSNDTFNFNVNVGCVDSDRDGFNASGCGVIDCNDNNANVIPPVDNYSINRSITFCPGDYSLASPIFINASDISVTCNSTNLITAGFASEATLWSINQSNVLVRNCNISGTSQAGILFEGTPGGLHFGNNTARNNTVVSSLTSYGILMKYSDNDSVLNNSVSGMTFGVGIWDSSGNRIANNSIRSTSEGIPFFPGSDNRQTILNNFISDGVFGIGPESTNNTVISSNTVTNASSICINIFIDANNVTISNNIITNCSFAGVGIGSPNNSIIGNFINESGIGIFATANNVTVKNNKILNTDTYAMNLGSSNLVQNNTMANITSIGIFACGTGNNEFIGNNLQNVSGGIVDSCTSEHNDVIIGNTIINTGTYGTAISLSGGPAENLTVLNNYVVNGTGTGILFPNAGGSNYIINNNTVINFTSGIFACGAQRFNITMTNNRVTDSLSGLTFGCGGMNLSRIENNVLINISGTAISVAGTGGSSIAESHSISNNFILCKAGAVAGISETGPTMNNASVFSNTIENCEDGMDIGAGGLANSRIAVNSISGSSNAGINFASNPDENNTVQNNTFTNNLADILSTPLTNNTLIQQAGTSEVKFIHKYLNVSSMSNIYVNSRIVALNASAEPQTNQSAQITFSGVTLPTIFRLENFTTNPDEVTSSGTECNALNYCQDISFSGGILSFNVTGFSSYAVKATTQTQQHGQGGGNTILTQPPVILTPKIPLLPALPAQPVTEKPAPVAILTSITPDEININNFGCIKIGNSSVSRTAIGTPQNNVNVDDINIMKGYEVLVSPFNVDCNSNSFKITVSLPDSYSNITALRCSADVCNPISLEQVDKLDCGGQIFQDVKRSNLFLEPQFFPVPLNKAELQPGADVLQSSSTRVQFIGAVNGKVSMDKLFGPAPEAANPNVEIVGTPTVISFDNSNPVSEMNITLPYAVSSDVDEFSISVYALKNGQWNYVDGDVDMSTKTVSVTMRNVSQYLVDNKLTVVPMGMLCVDCYQTKLQQIYNGGSRDAIVLVHGFENSPARFEDIINDVRLTNQPWQVWTFGYPSNQVIEDSAKEFADLLQAKSSQFDYLYITAHSLGGLITQQALYYAYQQNQNKARQPYTFISKIRKVILIATPNEGAFTGQPVNLINFLINSQSAAGIFSLNSKLLDEVIRGEQIPRLPNVDYVVIAGTEPYDFTKLFNLTETNDGIVRLSSAQTVGGKLINDSCSNFFSINATHTDILNNFDSRRIIESIVSNEVEKSVNKTALMGYNQYYDLDVSSCNPGDVYVIVGTPLPKAEQPNPGLCSCGNGICGADETPATCPADCAVLQKPKANWWDILLSFKPLKSLLSLILLLALILIAIAVLTRRHRPKQVLLPPVAGGKEEVLNRLLIDTRVSLRTGDLDKAAILYERFDREYSDSSLAIKQKFQDAVEKLKNELERKGL